MGAFREERKSRPSPPLPISYMSWRGEELLLFSLAAPSSAPSDVVEMGWLSDGAHPPFLPHSLHTLFTSPTYSAKTIERTRRGRRNSPLLSSNAKPTRASPLASFPFPPFLPTSFLLLLLFTSFLQRPFPTTPSSSIRVRCNPKRRDLAPPWFFNMKCSPLSLSEQSLFRQFFRSGSHYSRQKGSEDGDGTLSVLEEMQGSRGGT